MMSLQDGTSSMVYKYIYRYSMLIGISKVRVSVFFPYICRRIDNRRLREDGMGCDKNK